MLTLDQVKLSDEVRETLSKRGIDSMTKLLNIDSGEMIRWCENGCTKETLGELAQALLRRFIRPGWFRRISEITERDKLTEAPPGWHLIITNCSRSESWIIETTIADMERGAIEWCLVKNSSGTELWRKGGVRLEEE